jgi:hypothetical protein
MINGICLETMWVLLYPWFLATVIRIGGQAGLPNLKRHIEGAAKFGVPV